MEIIRGGRHAEYLLAASCFLRTAQQKLFYNVISVSRCRNAFGPRPFCGQGDLSMLAKPLAAPFSTPWVALDCTRPG
jgi:hypothetical protein